MGKTYSAPLICEVTKEIDDTVETFAVNLGELPIMVRSDHCHLANLPPDEMVNQCEDPYEYGGYFIINGNEKIIRMLIIQKRNFPVAFLRPSYTSRGVGYTQFAVQMRCVREDLYARTFTLHYISDGNIYLRLLYKKQEFLIPLIIILKALGDVTDRQIYTRLLNGKFGDSAKSDKVEVLIKTAKNMGYTTREQCLTYLGNSFRFLLSIGLSYSDYQAG
jgi:DNA-directed RNA polymerase I subunit RPA2